MIGRRFSGWVAIAICHEAKHIESRKIVLLLDISDNFLSLPYSCNRLETSGNIIDIILIKSRNYPISLYGIVNNVTKGLK